MPPRAGTTAVWSLIVWVCAATCPEQALAQAPVPSGLETNSGPIIPFLEGTDVFSPLRKDVVFEADIFPHLFVYQDFADIVDLDRRDPRGRRRPAVVISGTPAVRLRMFEEVSRPVRTPSYMPRGNVQFIWAGNLPEAIASLSQRQRSDVWLLEAHAIVGHHSNGQKGCLYADERRDGEACVRVDGLPRVVNREDGSFSTNFVRTGLHIRFNALDDTGWAFREWGAHVGVEHHPAGWVDEGIVDLYGRTRIQTGGAWAMRDGPGCGKRLELAGSTQFIIGAPDQVWPVALTAQVSCLPFRRGGWGFFVRYYGGQDYYNIGFLENIQRVHVGTTFNQSGFFRFRRPVREAAPAAP